MKQKQTKNKHSGPSSRRDQWTMDMQNRLKSTLEGKISRMETFIESVNEETDSIEIKVKLRSLIQLQKNVEELRNNYYTIPNVKDAELTAIDEDLHLLEVRLESLEVRIETILNSSKKSSSGAVMKTNDNFEIKTKIPPLVLPEFSGKYEEFSSFKIQFDDLITNNILLNEFQKLYYLRSCLTHEVNYLLIPELNYLSEHEKETVVQERKKLPEADRSEETVLMNSDSSNILDELLELSNNYFKVINILLSIFRFNYNFRNKSKKVGPLTVAEFKESEIKLIKHAQRSLFDNKEIPSSISNLFPFVYGEGIVRVGGRLENASMPYLHKHPVILPKCSKLSRLYFNSLHTRLFHVGPQGLLNAVRQKVWPLSGRSIARKTVHQYNCTNSHHSYHSSLVLFCRGRGSLVVKVTDSWPECHEFEPCTAEGPPCRGAAAL
ncbi:integrase catalytic domain-containing protein [Trichonephila clavipes]|nr:integrase catalytic domain-containing protein [Trichonephila clavipes]